MGDNDKDIGRLEGRVDALEGWMRSIDGKVDQLLEAAHMGRGAWFAIVKVGGVMVLACGAFAWLWDHLPKGVK